MNNQELAEAALAYIDENGLPSLSFRKLSDATGVPAMTIKNRFGSKDALLRAALAVMLEEKPLLAPPGERWDESLRRVAHHHRGMALSHPNAFPLFLMVPSFEQPMLDYTRRVFSSHGGQDIPAELPYAFLSVMHSFLPGFQMAELYASQADRSSLNPETRQLAEMFSEETFARNLEIIIEGLASHYRLPLH